MNLPQVQLTRSSGSPGTAFSLIQTDNPPRKLSVNPIEERVTSVHAVNSCFIGDVEYQDGVKIDGQIKGTVRFGTDDGLCIVSKSANIEGNLIGPRALILGRVTGDVCIDGLLLLAPGSVVDGNVSYGRIIVYDGAEISGTMRKRYKDAIENPLSSASMNFEEEDPFPTTA